MGLKQFIRGSLLCAVAILVFSCFPLRVWSEGHHPPITVTVHGAGNGVIASNGGVPVTWWPVINGYSYDVTLRNVDDWTEETFPTGAGSFLIPSSKLLPNRRYLVIVTGRGPAGTVEGAAETALFVSPQAPPDFGCPASQTSGKADLLFRWPSKGGAKGYHITVEDVTSSPVTIKSEDVSHRYMFELRASDLELGHIYRVTLAVSTIGGATESQSCSFEVKNVPPPPTLVAPVITSPSAGDVEWADLVVGWETVKGALRYYVNIKVVNEKDTPDKDAGVGYTLTISKDQLVPEQRYRITVAAQGGEDRKEWSQAVEIYVKKPLVTGEVTGVPPTEPTVTEPRPNVTHETETPRTETPKVAPPKSEPPAVEPSKTETPTVELPKSEPPEAEPPKTEPPKTEPPKTEPPKTEPPKTEPPKTEPPEKELPKSKPPVTPPPDPGPPPEGFSPRERILFLLSMLSGLLVNVLHDRAKSVPLWMAPISGVLFGVVLGAFTGDIRMVVLVSFGVVGGLSAYIVRAWKLRRLRNRIRATRPTPPDGPGGVVPFPSSVERAFLLKERALSASQQRQFASALSQIQEARELLRGANRDEDLADILWLEGRTLAELGRYDEARQCYLAAQELNEELGRQHQAAQLAGLLLELDHLR